MRSASETEYHLLLAQDLGYLDAETYKSLNDQVIEVKLMLTGFIGKLSTDS
jgi:four helix bundle protein